MLNESNKKQFEVFDKNGVVYNLKHTQRVWSSYEENQGQIF